MDVENPVCPVCTLFLRPGITLEAHLKSHPKQKVIEALVRLSNNDAIPKVEQTSSNNQAIANSQSSTATITSPPWPTSGVPMPINGIPPNFPSVPGNHSFIYQQIMSSTSQQPGVLSVNPMNQQYITIPAVFNPQMMCSPYVYQQQQVIIHRPLPLELPDSSRSTANQISPIPSNFSSSPSIVEQTDCDVIEKEQKENDEEYLEEHMTDNEEGLCNFQEVNDDEILDKLEVKADLDVDTKRQEVSELPVTEEYEDEEGGLLSPHTPALSDCSSISKIKTDLNKACQTQHQMSTLISVESIEEQIEEANDLDQDLDKPEYFIPNQESQGNYVTLDSNYEEESPKIAYAQPTTNENGHTNEVNFIEMDGMNLVLSNDFMGSSQVISQEDYDYLQNRSERPRILMSIGNMDGSGEIFLENQEVERIGEEQLSSQSANIRADESMPLRGEISGPESNGATSDVTAWNRIQYHEGSSGMSTSYDLLARETWEASDASDSEMPPAQSRVTRETHYEGQDDDDDDTPMISGYSDPPLMYKCPTCNESFKCPKERRVHQAEKHNKAVNEIGSKLGKKKVKKLIIKAKKTVEVKTENSFDFTNKLKIETMEMDVVSVDRASVILPPISSSLIPIETKIKEPSINDPLLCGLCDEIVPNSKALKEHRLEIHKLSQHVKHKCTTCEEVFPTEPKYTEHLKIHPLECKLCGKLFYRRQSIQLHMKRHFGIKPYKCNSCDKSFLTKQKHDEHKNIHTGEAPIKCNLCDETFRRHSNLIQHRNRHHLNIKKKVKDFVCQCGEIFHSKKKLAWHKEIHDTKPKSCTHCSEKFIHMSSLTRHMRRAHNDHYVPKDEKNKENVECPICKGIYLKSSLDTHIKSHSGARPFTCLICNKDFTTKWNLKLHKWTHASRTLKPFKCELCKGAFIREPDYIAHMNSHKSVRPYTCNYCGQQFIRKYNCQRHVREHEKGKMFSCTVCNKQFHRSYYLNDHMRVHSGLRPYSCHICGKASTTKSNHNKHVRIHHAREPVSTEN